MKRRSVLIGLLALALAALVLFLVLFFGLPSETPPASYAYDKAAVAADAGRCSEIGRDILKKKGSAVDSAIAALLCVGLMHPQSSGIGGGLFITVYNSSTGTVEVINARETAPRNISTDMFGSNQELAQKGGKSIAVPGEIRGYELAHKRYGRLPWKQLFEPTIHLARRGFSIGEDLSMAISKKQEDIKKDSHLRKVFCNSKGEILKKGEMIRFTKLARTLEIIANEGPDAFYTGSLATSIVKDIKDASYNFTSKSVQGKDKALTYHRILEAFKFAYAERSKLGDPEFINIDEQIHNMTSEAFARDLYKKIKDNTTLPIEDYGSKFYIPDNTGTTHLSVVAEDGSAVSATSTINNFFGSLVLSNSTGILFNDIMDDFSFPHFNNSFGAPPSIPNFIKPGKRPFSSMCPSILLDKNHQVKMAVGGAGGTKITTATALVMMNVLWFDYDVNKAVKEPRVHNQLSPNNSSLEHGVDKSVREGLQMRQHNIDELKNKSSSVQIIVRKEGKWIAESDFRKGGQPAGY
ncbi:glutathione hydrolase 1 proenzyme-like isoform X2 [Latimeria chalumnae]|uniref:glutathione hydrolase 1 proenzyme-like isoform X2 n=1 Tax=Latimeria chalumnae TaxID=7897 RepID=UPI00313BA597